MQKRGMPAIVLAAIFIVLPFLALKAHAAVIYTNARPSTPAIGFAPRYGTYLLVWSEDRGTGTGLDLYAVRLTLNGVAQGTEIPLLVANGNQSDPTMAFSEQINEFMVMYTDDSGGQAPGVPNPGNPPPNPGQPTLPAPGQPTPPVPPPPPLLVDGVDWPKSFNDSAIRALPQAAQGQMLLIGPDGQPVTQPETANPAAAAGLIGGPIRHTRVENANDPNNYIDGKLPAKVAEAAHRISGIDRGGNAGAFRPLQATATPTATATADPNAPAPPGINPGSRDIYGMFVTASGQRASVIFPVITSPGDDTYPDLTYLPRGGRGDQIAFVWRQVDGVDVSVKSMELSPVGRFFEMSAVRNVVAGGDIGRPSVAAEIPSGQYLVVWSQTPKDDNTRDIYGRRLNNNAFPVGGSIRIARSKAPIDDVYPSVGSLGAFGGFVIAWERRDGTDAPDIQTRRMNRNGIPYRTEYAMAGGPAFSFAPDIASSDNINTLAVWVDRNPASDNTIMGAEVSRTGQRRGPERLLVIGGSGPAGATPVVPGPGLPTVGPPVPPPPPAPLP